MGIFGKRSSKGGQSAAVYGEVIAQGKAVNVLRSGVNARGYAVGVRRCDRMRRRCAWFGAGSTVKMQGEASANFFFNFLRLLLTRQVWLAIFISFS
jgi:hypothetical protein